MEVEVRRKQDLEGETYILLLLLSAAEPRTLCSCSLQPMPGEEQEWCLSLPCPTIRSARDSSSGVSRGTPTLCTFSLLCSWPQGLHASSPSPHGLQGPSFSKSCIHPWLQDCGLARPTICCLSQSSWLVTLVLAPCSWSPIPQSGALTRVTAYVILIDFRLLTHLLLWILAVVWTTDPRFSNLSCSWISGYDPLGSRSDHLCLSHVPDSTLCRTVSRNGEGETSPITRLELPWVEHSNRLIFIIVFTRVSHSRLYSKIVNLQKIYICCINKSLWMMDNHSCVMKPVSL